MNATTNRNSSSLGSNSTSKPHGSRLLAIGALACMIIFCIASQSRCQSRSETPATVESMFAQAVRPAPTRLQSAREAAKRGERDLAIHDYVTSIQEDVSTAELAIGEMVKVFLSVARAHGGDGRYVEQSAQISRCYQTLTQLKQADVFTKALPEPVRKKLFQEIARVRSASKDAAQAHIDAAENLRWEAKGNYWWNDDDEDMQAEALHRVNLAWSYYSVCTDESQVDSMYEIWADMKSELATWQYNQVMERDRLHLGRVVGDR